VGDVHGVSLQKQPNLTVYIPYWQRFRTQIALAVRVSGDPAPTAAAIRAEVRTLVPAAPAPRVVTGDEIVAGSLAARRFQVELVLFFGVAALFLAAVGVYGVVSQSIARRTQEIGIRMALGASRRDVWSLVALEGLTPIVGGLAVGLAGAIAAAQLVRGLLFQVGAFDPLTFALVALVLVMAALFACLVPAARASRLDPLVALRVE
jgi:putative ABC transport system permease protein